MKPWQGEYYVCVQYVYVEELLLYVHKTPSFSRRKYFLVSELSSQQQGVRQGLRWAQQELESPP